MVAPPQTAQLLAGHSVVQVALAELRELIVEDEVGLLVGGL